MNDKRRTILVVEDDPALQKQMRWAFDSFETVVADDRESALAQLRRYEPAVVTMDLGLPPSPDDVAEGFRLLGEMLVLAPDTKVIVLTGHTSGAALLEALSHGAHGYLNRRLLRAFLPKAVRKVDQCEPWVSRKLLPRIIESLMRLGNPPGSGSPSHH